MASGSNSLNISQPTIPIFNLEGYEHWAIMMKNLFRSQDLWELVEKSFSKQDDEPRLKENRKGDAKALCLIHHAMQRLIFSCIVMVNTAKRV